MLQIIREQASIYINADYWLFYIHSKEISKKALCIRNRFLFSFLSKDGSQEKCKSEATHKFRTFSSFAFSSSSTARVSGVALSPGGFLTLQTPYINKIIACSTFNFFIQSRNDIHNFNGNVFTNEQYFRTNFSESENNSTVNFGGYRKQ